MQFKIWLDDTNVITIACKLASSGSGGPSDGAEVIAATIAESKLSDIQVDELLDVVGQAVDHLTAEPSRPVSPQEDWRDHFRKGTLK